MYYLKNIANVSQLCSTIKRDSDKSYIQKSSKVNLSRRFCMSQKKEDYMAYDEYLVQLKKGIVTRG